MKVFLSVYLLSFIGCASTISGTLKPADPTVKLDYTNARINISRLDTQADLKGNQIVEVDDEGNFESVEDLVKGKYLVEALIPGFEAKSQTVVLSSSKEIHLKVSPLEGANARAIGTNMDVELGKGAGGATLMPPNL